MAELLLRRKGKFLQYLFATAMFIVDHFAQMLVFSMILGAIEQGSAETYGRVAIVVIGFIFYAPANFLISRMLRIRYMRDTILDVRKQAFDKIMAMSYKQYSQKSKEVYLSNLINDVNQFESKFFISLLNFLINAGMTMISLLILLFLDVKLTMGMLLYSLFLVVLAGFFRKRAILLEQQVSTENEKFTTELANTFNGVEILKLNKIEDRFRLKTMDTLTRLERKKLLSSVFTDLQRYVIHIFSTGVALAVMIYLAYALIEGMPMATAGLLFQLCTSISRFLIEAFPMWNQMKAAVGIYEKIAAKDGETEEQERGSVPFQLEQTLQVSDVSFGFGQKQILKQASFVIEKGKKYLIKGVSGAGKSTLMNLLARAIDDYEGSIMADGVDYRSISEKSFHDKVAFIYQDVFLFEDTIKNNIALYREIPDGQIEYAVKLCGLESIITDRKLGIHERLSENGKNLSGGQRQRISIARAIAKQAEILFVDEGTSSLNEELGREIEQVFLELENTVIAISHRFYEGVTDQYDYVLEIKNGQVSQFPAKDYFGEVVAC